MHKENKDINGETQIIKLWKKAAIEKKYSQVQRDGFKDLERGLWVLKISKEKFKKPYLTAAQINLIITEVFDLPSRQISLTRAFARAGGPKRTKKLVIVKKDTANIFYYKITKPGEEYLDSLEGRGLLKILYLKPDSHRDSRRKLEDLVSKLKGKELKICDPYYGLNTLGVLEEIVRSGHRVKFLSHKTNENVTKFNKELTYLKKHYPKKIELRIYPKKELHDRYILCDDAFLIVGQGIKDLGNKESLVVVIEDRFGKETRKLLEKTFFERWNHKDVIIL